MKELTAIHTDDIGLDESNVIQLVGMKLGEEEYAIDVLKIQEIIRTVEITIVPRSENYILGVMNLRGKVIPVIDLRVRFNLDKMDFDKSTRIIVVRFEKDHIGFVVDEVTQVIRISKSMVEPTPPLVGAIGQEYILGICKYNERLIILLDIDRVVAKAGGTISESDLRKKFLGTKEKVVRPPVAVMETKKTETKKPEPAAPNKYSMADEVESPVILPDEDDDDSDDMDNSINAVLQDAVKQSENVTKNNSGNEVHQSELDALIALELAKREAETEELNKKKKAGGDHSSQTAEEALNIDELIAMELSKREAETEELNKKRASEDDKKKNELIAESVIDDNVSDAEPSATVNEQDDDVKREASLATLKEVANKIINGESQDLDLDIKGEFGELISLLVDIKSRVDEISPTVLSSQTELPSMSSTLNDVDTATEKAAFNLLGSAQKMNDFYKNLRSQVSDLEKSIEAQDTALFNNEKDKISDQINDAGELGLHILEALEFQDITEQKLRKVLKSIEDVGARLGVIVGYIKSKDSSDKKEYDEVLTDLGFA